MHEGRVYGRGSVDMKGGLACALFAVKAIRDAGIALRGSVLVESVIGEEDGGIGTLAACLRGYRADGAVVVEPTELKVAPAQAGALTFRITVPGLSAHACVREEGVSAVEKFLPVHAALLALERERNHAVRDPLFRRYRLPFALSLGRLEARAQRGAVERTDVDTGDGETRHGTIGVERLRRKAEPEREAQRRERRDEDARGEGAQERQTAGPGPRDDRHSFSLP